MTLRAVENQAGRGERNRLAETLLANAISEGSASHPYASSPRLREGPEAIGNLADAVHHLCLLHGRMPGLIDFAVRHASADAAVWLQSAAASFAEERALLARLAVASPPPPSTAGQAECEATVIAQRHALEMLANSERQGCALGAAVALLLDWRKVRTVLDLAVDRLGLVPAASALPDHPSIAAFVAASTIGAERAVAFGAQQVFIQQRGLWDLLEARDAARR